MNWFEKLWNFVVSSNDDPFIKEISKLEDDKKKLQAEIDRVGENYLDANKTIETLQNELSIVNDKLQAYQEKEAQTVKEGELEAYWNNKRPKNDFYEYPARPPLEGTNNIDLDPRLFYAPEDSNLPIVSGNSHDDIASAALDYVIRRLTYTSDPTQFKLNEAWLFAFETWKLKKGDCEDGAILLANIMLKSGIPYWRIRLNAGDVKGGGHCWVTYLRESDNQWVVLDWCYWPNEAKDLKLLWKDAENYFSIWFSWNVEHIYKNEVFDRK